MNPAQSAVFGGAVGGLAIGAAIVAFIIGFTFGEAGGPGIPIEAIEIVAVGVALLVFGIVMLSFAMQKASKLTVK